MNKFNDMFEIAENTLKNVENKNNTQVIVVKTEKRNYHKVITDVLSDCCNEEYLLLDEMKQNNDTHVEKILCMWTSGEIDLPSFRFRKNLCTMNELNVNAEIFLKCGNGINTKKILSTL